MKFRQEEITSLLIPYLPQIVLPLIVEYLDDVQEILDNYKNISPETFQELSPGKIREMTIYILIQYGITYHRITPLIRDALNCEMVERKLKPPTLTTFLLTEDYKKLNINCVAQFFDEKYRNVVVIVSKKEKEKILNIEKYQSIKQELDATINQFLCHHPESWWNNTDLQEQILFLKMLKKLIKTTNLLEPSGENQISSLINNPNPKKTVKFQACLVKLTEILIKLPHPLGGCKSWSLRENGL